MSCGVGCRRSSDPALLWLWWKSATTAPIPPLAWKPPYGVGAALKRKKKKKNSCKTKWKPNSDVIFWYGLQLFKYINLKTYANYQPSVWILPWLSPVTPYHFGSLSLLKVGKGQEMLSKYKEKWFFCIVAHFFITSF